MKPNRTLAQFDYFLDGFYLMKSTSAGKCPGCGQVIPAEFREFPANRAWLQAHWRGENSQAIRIPAAGLPS